MAITSFSQGNNKYWHPFIGMLLLVYLAFGCLFYFHFPTEIVEPAIFTLFIIFIVTAYRYYPQLFVKKEWDFSPRTFVLTIFTTLLFCMLIAFYKHTYLPHQPVFSGRLLNPTFSLPQMILYLLAYAISCPVQEFFARGIIQKALFNIYPKYKGAYSIFMASMLFALLHIYISPKMVALALILGLYWGTLYHYFRNLLAITLSHLLIGIWTLYLVGFDQFIYP